MLGIKFGNCFQQICCLGLDSANLDKSRADATSHEAGDGFVVASATRQQS
jgi:hypothetical protein